MADFSKPEVEILVETRAIDCSYPICCTISIVFGGISSVLPVLRWGSADLKISPHPMKCSLSVGIRCQHYVRDLLCDVNNYAWPAVAICVTYVK